MIKQLSLLQRFAVIQLMISLLLVFTSRWWCGLFGFYGTDLCWLLQATPVELERAFPHYYRWVFLVLWFCQYLLPALSIILAAFLLAGRQLRQNMLLVLLSSLLTLLLAEAALYALGHKPGQFNYSKWIRPVDSLRVITGFVTDEAGITKVDTALTNAIMVQHQSYGPTGRPFPNDWEYWYEMAGVMTDHSILQGGDTVINRFQQRLYRLRSIPSAQWSTSDSLFLHFANHPFNDEGFYSLPFTVGDDVRPRILLLGDSFAWGHSTINKTSSFANELLARGYNLFNTGISGADVSQYLAILRKYGPMLKPQVVVCNFFMGNDVQYFERTPKQQVPLAFHTNAGVIYSNHNGKEFSSARAAYDNIMSNMVIPKTTVVNRLMSKTVVTTYVWFFLANTGMVKHEFFQGQLYPEEPITEKQIAEMAAICDSLGADFILSIIPKFENGKIIGAESMPGIFGAVPYHQPQVSPEMYKHSDGHFNDAGHLHYADHLEKLIVKYTTAP